jgi:hypothetical protein
MLWGKKALRVAAALAVAFGAAHTAERLKAPAVEQSLLAAASEAAGVDQVNRAASRTAAVPASASLSAPADTGLSDVIGITPVAASAPPAGDGRCQPKLDLAPLPGALIQLSLSAPCNRAERIVLRHSGLSFSAQTQADGRATIILPALKSDAMVAVYFQDSRLVLGKVTVPDVSAFARLAIVWDAPTEMDLRVADGDKVLIGSTAMVAGPVQQVIALGAPQGANPVLARVYSVPGSRLDDADITGELRITEATCGRTLRMQTVYSVGGVAHQAERSVAVPLCGTAGDILVLKNLAPALKLAAPE